MSRAVKWILGIVSGLVALCALAVAGFFILNRFSLSRVIMARRGVMPFEGPRALPLVPYQGMPYRHFGGFTPFGFFGSWLIVAGAIGLFVLAVAALILVLRRPRQAVAPSGLGTPYPPAAPGGPGVPDQAVRFDQAGGIPGGPGVSERAAAEVTPEASVSGGNCPSCGRAVQADWSHCPYCGTGLTGSS
jgi:hypothetical protein